MAVRRWIGLAAGLIGCGAAWADGPAATVAVVPADKPTPLYVSNKAPLAVSPLVRLPIGSITPRGWLRKQLELEADGMGGRLPEVSKWCQYDGSAWTDPHGEGKNGWEEVPYWLKGFGDLGYVLNDKRIIGETKRWIDAIIAAQQDDGWFGPVGLKTANDGKPDLWPHMAVLNALQSYYEYTDAQGKPDERIIMLMDRYFKWELNCPDDQFMHGYWPEMRTGDNLESVYWLYNRTGESWLLDVAEKIQKHTPHGWMTGLPMLHNVNVAQGFREPAEYWMQSHDEKYRKATDHAYNTIMDTWGQVPGGGFCADENARKGFTDPRQGFETCGMVEYMHSFEMLTRIQGTAVWADRCEDVAFNDFPAAMTPDLKALHYLTSPNSVQLDEHNHAPDIQNGGEMISYSPGPAYRCCQHNHTMGWPYYAEELWLATADQGLCASLYADSSVTAKVNGGTMVTVDEKTEYPFDGTVTLTMAWDQGVAVTPTFPLYLRIPKWSEGASIKINGDDVAVTHVAVVGHQDADGKITPDAKYDLSGPVKPDSFIVLNRAWKNGDVVTLNLPMHVSVRKWEKNKDSVSIDYGPLTFSLKIGEQMKQYGNVNGWPAYDVYATTPWNYGLYLNPTDPTVGIDVIKKKGPVADQPWTQETAPIEIRLMARKIANWKADRLNMVGVLQQSPIRTDEKPEIVTLIPMGAARLRISQFPTTGDGADAHEWPAGPVSSGYRASASHVHGSDTLDALDDGILPQNSADESIPRFTWWDHRGTAEWVQYDFPKAMEISSSDVYWFDDAPTGGHCRPPVSWSLQFKDGDAWKPVEGASAFEHATDKFNHVTFKPVTTTAMRMTVQLQDDESAGILEWKVGK
jgi:hypothetical protein